MVEQLIWEREPSRELRSPILVTAWDGLFDVGGAATGAIEVLRSNAATKVGYVDADEARLEHAKWLDELEGEAAAAAEEEASQKV